MKKGLSVWDLRVGNRAFHEMARWGNSSLPWIGPVVKVALPLLRKVFAWSFISFFAPNKLKLLIWVLTYESIASWYNERPKENSEKNTIIIKPYSAYWWWWLRSSHLPCKGTYFKFVVNIRKKRNKVQKKLLGSDVPLPLRLPMERLWSSLSSKVLMIADALGYSFN